MGDLRLWRSRVHQITTQAMPPDDATSHPSETERALIVARARDLEHLLPPNRTPA